MAIAYGNPIPAPDFLDADGRYDHESYMVRCKAYREATERYIRAELGGKHKLTGKVIRFQIADGYAQYMLWTPTKWIHLDEIDGYHAHEATIRGMRTADVVAQIERQERMAAFFAERAAEVTS